MKLFKSLKLDWPILCLIILFLSSWSKYESALQSTNWIRQFSDDSASVFISDSTYSKDFLSLEIIPDVSALFDRTKVRITNDKKKNCKWSN